MESFQLKHVEVSKVLFTLIVIPTVSVLIFLTVMLQFPNLSDLVLYIVIYTFLALMILFILWLSVKKLTADCLATVDEKGLEIKFTPPSLYYGNTVYRGWENVSLIKDTIDSHTGTRVVVVKLKKPYRKLSLYSDDLWEEQIDNFFEAVSANKDNYTQR